MNELLTQLVDREKKKAGRSFDIFLCFTDIMKRDKLVHDLLIVVIILVYIMINLTSEIHWRKKFVVLKILKLHKFIKC
jgi:hypothetical protein